MPISEDSPVNKTFALFFTVYFLIKCDTPPSPKNHHVIIGLPTFRLGNGQGKILQGQGKSRDFILSEEKLTS